MFNKEHFHGQGFFEWGPQDESPGDERGPRACFSGTFCILRGLISSGFSGTYKIWNMKYGEVVA